MSEISRSNATKELATVKEENNRLSMEVERLKKKVKTVKEENSRLNRQCSNRNGFPITIRKIRHNHRRRILIRDSKLCATHHCPPDSEVWRTSGCFRESKPHCQGFAMHGAMMSKLYKFRSLLGKCRVHLHNSPASNWNAAQRLIYGRANQLF
ncbi:hypothetical protein RND81_09G171300 [Saponaria officinalis]|uniref:Uncharacterized protein n=1 Tax=Saponaria officinalis TaxID=3572 RepID=A0AAW1ILV7_SAPOF